MGRLRTTLLTLAPLFAVGCIGAEPALVDGGPAAETGGGRDGTTGADGSGSGKGSDAASDARTPHDAGVDVASKDAGADTGLATDSGHDAGVDATGICNALVAYDGAPPGSIDPTFGAGTVSVAASAGGPGRLLQDSKGRIYLIGNKTDCVTGTSNTDFAVTRLNPDGTPDLTYGAVDGGMAAGLADAGFAPDNQGTVCIDFEGGADLLYAVALDSNENLIVAGFATKRPTVPSETPANYFYTARPAVARLTPAGFLDTTFNGTGKNRILSGPAEAQEVNAIAVDSENNLFLVGTTQALPVPSSLDAATATYAALAGFIVKLNGTTTGGGTPGTVVSGWGSHFNGFEWDDSLSGYNSAAVVGSGADERLVVVGTDLGHTVDGGGSVLYHRRFVTRQYKAAGQGGLDTTFNAEDGGSFDAGTNGQVLTAPGQNDFALSVLIDPDGNILVGGIASVGTPGLGGGGFSAGEYGPGYAAVVRYKPNGSLDTSFNNSGIYVSPDLKGFPAYEGDTLALQCDGKILFGALVCPQAAITSPSYAASSQNPGVLRLLPTGSPDTTYGNGAYDAGIGIADLRLGTQAFVTSLLLDPTQRVLVLNGLGGTNPVMTRFLP